eukprot:1378391-Pleurochrysis_carterae.AAC.4
MGYYTPHIPAASRGPVRKALKKAETLLTSNNAMDRCAGALTLLQLRDELGWFAEPVDVEYVPDYLEIVQTPMDFSTIKRKLSTGAYGDDPHAFAADVRRVYTNAIKYNWSPEHECHVAARQACFRRFPCCISSCCA